MEEYSGISWLMRWNSHIVSVYIRSMQVRLNQQSPNADTKALLVKAQHVVMRRRKGRGFLSAKEVNTNAKREDVDLYSALSFPHQGTFI
ncbi:MAG: hypothetical protein GF353_00730 [Candidatus Lokiarchaeota archaeon]|nr:hypothetical protein [Candidatus Lokiarchaeota archaeon]